MSFFERPEQRDDMYSLAREGCDVEERLPRVGALDRSHMFLDGTGEIFPASKLRAANGNGVRGVVGKSLKLGPAHSHEIIGGTRLHILENGAELRRDLIKKARKKIADFRKRRRDKE